MNSAPKLSDAIPVLKRLFRLIPHRGRTIALVVFSVVVSVTVHTLAPTLVGQAITNHLELSKNWNGFFASMVVVLALYLTAWLVDAVSGYLMTRLSMTIVTQFRGQVFNHVQSLPLQTMEKRLNGDLISRMTNDIEMVFNAMINGFQNSISGAFSLIGIVIAMVLLNGTLTLIVLGSVPFLVFFTRYLSRRIKKAFVRNQEILSRMTQRIEETVTGLRTVISFGKERDEIERFNALSQESYDAGVHAEFTGYTMIPLMSVLTTVTMTLLVSIGGVLAVGGVGVGGVSVGLLISFIMYGQRFFEPLSQLAQVFSMLQSASAGAMRVFEIMDERPQDDPGKSFPPLESVKGHVRFENVSFGYYPPHNILENVSLDIRPGEKVAVVGPTGAGKTTLIKLLARFYEIQSGDIFLDGRSVRSLSLEQLRSSMSIVLQEPFFFSATIRENLLYARLDATEEQMLEASRNANAHEFIQHLPQGYDTVLSERASNLSQGERQRLGIARALLADPPLLILDEATSHLDTLTERKVQEALSVLMKGRTALIIAHRLSTIINADKILVVHNRRIVEQGTHAELIQNPDGLYRKLYFISANNIGSDERSIDYFHIPPV